MEFPRKRALIACNFCRHRKRKCDGQRPACGFCATSGAQCEYQENSNERSDTDLSTEIVLRLDRLESLVRQQTAVISALSDRLLAITAKDTKSTSPIDPSTSNNVHVNGASHTTQIYNSLASDTSALIDTRMRYEYSDDPLLIPLGHQTPTGNLLSLEKIKSLIGDYSQDFFLFLESKRCLRPLAPTVTHSAVLDKLNASREATDFLVSSFCTSVHPHFPILERKTFEEMFETFLQSSDGRTSSDALCFIILALGEICSATSNIYDTESQTESNGTEFFTHAYRILATEGLTLFSWDVKIPLTYFFASLYFRYRGRALEAWKMVHAASSGVQLMFSYLRGKTIPQEQRDLLIRLSWSCYVMECDDLAEFHFPRSGIEILVDGLPFPEFTEPTERNGLVFLAMCSVRKLLNRIHNTMYAGNSETDSSMPQHHPMPAASLEALNIELSRQLEAWFDSLPESIKPDLQDPNPRDVQDGQIRSRYFAAKHILCRPSLVLAAQSRSIQLTADLIENSKICVDSCRDFVLTTVPLLKNRTHSTWLRLQALLAAVFVLSIAKATPSLAFLVPDFDEIIDKAIQCTEPWAQYHETAGAILNIFQSIRRKLRLHVTNISVNEI